MRKILYVLMVLIPVTVNARSVITDTETEMLINEIIEPVAKAADITRLRVHIIDDNDFNAFVSGGEDVYIYTGLLKQIKSANALQAVVAHELGHTIGGHMAQMSAQMDAELMRTMIIQALGVGLMVAGGNPSLGAGVLAGGTGIANQSLMAFSRDEERIADTMAIDLLVRANQNPNGLIDVFEQMQEMTSAMERKINPNWVNHPLTMERLKNAREKISGLKYTYDASKYKKWQKRYELVRAKLIGYLDPLDRVGVLFPDSDKSDAAIYARAIANMRGGNLESARIGTLTLISRDKTNPYFYELLGGVTVNKFSIGFGPAIVKWHDGHNTQWQIACLPLGGYVSIYGQDDMFNRKKYSELPAQKRVGHYLSAPAWKQFIIIAAGVAMNFLLAWVIYSATFMLHPRPVQLPVVAQVVRQTPAFNAGIKPGDTILRIDGKNIANWGEVVIAKELAANNIANVDLLRNDKIISVKMEPGERWGLIADGSKKEIQKKGFFTAMYWGARETYYQSKTLLVVLKQIITGERSSKQLGSFITIAQVLGQALSAGAWAFLAIIALLSVNLGIINLLPLPVLDGGYLLILVIEAASRRKLQGRAMEVAIMCGWVLILALFLLTMWNDLSRVFGLN